MLMDVIPPHGPVLAYTTIKRLHRRVDLDVLVELHGVEEDLVAAVAGVGLGRVVVVVDVVGELELVGEDLAALVAHARGPRGIVDGTEVENGYSLSRALGRTVQVLCPKNFSFEQMRARTSVARHKPNMRRQELVGNTTRGIFLDENF